MNLPSFDSPSLALAPAIIAGIIAAGSAIVNKIQDQRAQRKQNKANLSLADKQFALDQTAIDRQNAYNSPLAQMGRYTDAGLNPNLIYQSGGSSGNQGSAASYNAPQIGAVTGPIPDFTGMLDQYQNFQMKGAQVDNIEAQTENTRSRTLNEALRGNLLDIQGKTGEFDLDTKNLMRPYNVSISESGVRRSKIQLQQEMERLALLKQTQLMNILRSDQMRSGLKTQDVYRERLNTDIIFNKFRNQWAKEGITTSDNPYLRIISRMMNASGFSLADFAGAFNQKRR